MRYDCLNGGSLGLEAIEHNANRNNQFSKMGIPSEMRQVGKVNLWSF